MPIPIRFHGHSAFELQHDGKTILIDPFLSENPVATIPAETLNPEAILLTHAHADHLGDTVDIAHRTGCLVVANYEITTWLEKHGVSHVHPMNLGGQFTFDFGTVKQTLAHHSSTLPDGSNGGYPAGLILTLGDKVIYHAGDTALFNDMELIGEAMIDLAIVPIGDNFTMGPDDAFIAVKYLRAKQVIPCHYNTWPIIEQDAQAWAERVNQETQTKATVLEPGETFELE